MGAVQLNDHETEAMGRFLNIVASFGNKEDIARFLAVNMAVSIGILRGLKGDQFVYDYLMAAFNDKNNIIDIEVARVQ